MTLIECGKYRGVLMVKDLDAEDNPYSFYCFCFSYRTLKEVKEMIDVCLKDSNAYVSNGCLKHHFNFKRIIKEC